MTIDRILIKHKRDRGKVDDYAEWSTFGLVMKEVKGINYKTLRQQD